MSNVQYTGRGILSDLAPGGRKEEGMKWELTGRCRFRIDDNDKLVLQVQDQSITTNYIGGRIDSEWVYRWRDAELQDVSKHEVQP